MDKAQDGVDATEDFSASVRDIPDIEIRHNLQEVTSSADRARDAVNSIPRKTNVEIHFERTGWSGVQEMSPKTRIQHMLENLDAFLRDTDFVVDFGTTGTEQIDTAMQQIGALQDAISGLGALADYEGLGEWSSVLIYYIPALEAFKRDLRLVIAALSEIADDLGPEMVDTAGEVADVIGDIGRALSYITEGLLALSTYAGIGEWSNVLIYYVPAMEDMKRDLQFVIDALGDVAIDTADAVPLAKAFAEDAAEIMSNIQAAVESLNELQGLGAEPYTLVEMGKNLVRSLADGFVEQAQGEQFRVIMAAANVINEVLRAADVAMPVMYTAGSDLGGSFIGGMIGGLESASSGLYAVIQGIVAAAIAEAESAAGVASPSKPMIDLGSMMGEGLALGLGASRADLERAMTGMVADTIAPAYAYAAPADRGNALGWGSRRDMQAFTRELAKALGRGDTTINVKTLEPASVAHQVGLTMNRVRVQAELGAGRG